MRDLVERVLNVVLACKVGADSATVQRLLGLQQTLQQALDKFDMLHFSDVRKAVYCQHTAL